MRKRQAPEGQRSLFDTPEPRKTKRDTAAPSSGTPGKWRMPEPSGRTIAEIRMRWPKRLTPAQVARVEAELSGLPTSLTKLGFGTVQVEHAFVRRRRA